MEDADGWKIHVGLGEDGLVGKTAAFRVSCFVFMIVSTVF